MKAINKVDIEIGNTDIPISIYSAIESETSFKQISSCCSSPVNYKKVCSSCSQELEMSQIKKALEIGEEFKEVDVSQIKTENGNLKILGIVQGEEEDGFFRDGNVWFIGFQVDSKNKSKTERNNLKYSYLRDSIREAKTSLIGLISVRGKEHITILKPYFNGFVGLGVYHFNRIRDIKEIGGYGSNVLLDSNVVKQMSEQIKTKESISIKNIENTREKLIEKAVTSVNEIKTKSEEINPLEIVSF